MKNISERRYFSVILSILFFLIFSTAFYLIYSDSDEVKAQIHNDFNQQQLILARQSSAQIDLFLNNLEIQLKNLKWFCSQENNEIRAEALRAFFEQNNKMGVIDIGYIQLDKLYQFGKFNNTIPPDSDFKNINYYHEAGIPELKLDDIINYTRKQVINNVESQKSKVESSKRGKGSGIRVGKTNLQSSIPSPQSQKYFQLANLFSDSLKLTRPDVIRNSRNRVFITSTIIKMIYPENQQPGFLIIRLDLSVLMKKINGKVRSGKTGYAWVIDDKGVALYHPENEFIGRNIFEARKEKKPYVNFSRINEIMKERMMKGEEGMAVYDSWWHRELSGQITKLIAFSPITHRSLPDNKMWSVAVVAPTNEVAEILDKAYLRHLGAEAFIIVGMFLFAILFLTYQRRIAETLKERVTEQEEYISSILEYSMDAIIFTDNENFIKVWNKGAEKMFGYTSQEMVGKTFHIIIPHELDAINELSRINELVSQYGYISNFIAQRITKSGKKIRVNISKTQINSEKGENLGYSIIIRDETEKTALEQRIYNTEKLASIGTLAAGVAHEINNPLAIILGYTDLLIEEFPKDSTIYQDLQVIESNANNAKKIVENLLSFARITEGLDDNINIKHSVGTVIEIVKNTLFTKKIEIEVNIPDDLPHVRGDVREYQQVVFNLINNAVDAMKSTGSGKISIEAKTHEDFVALEINDTGDGISEKYKQRIFDPFFTTKKVGEGTGLGLSLCYGIVSKFGGKISFRSVSKIDFPDEPSGTTFIVEMPVIN
ncbi:MAG: domain S-box protein [Ignavibacteria bacterium]|nr:domain S-box protein [Ignavibacteria bacterium]